VALDHGRRGSHGRELTRSVDYPVNLPSSRNWRVTALAAAAFAALELVLLVIIAIAAIGLPFAEEQKAQAQADVARSATEDQEARPERAKGGAHAAVPVATQPREETSVVVLNGNGITGAADLAAVGVRKHHYVLTGTGNAPRSDFPRTLVMYRPGFAGEAHRLARDVGVRRVAPLDGMRAGDLLGAQIALVVGRR
jgi:hypothetical protein